MNPSTPSVDPNSIPSPEFDFQEIYHLLREKAWIIVLCVVVAGSLAGAYIMRTPKTYAARTLVQIDQARRKVVNIEEISREDLSSLELLKTIEQNMASGVLLKRVIEVLSLTPEQIGLPTIQRAYSENELIGRMQKQVSVKLMRGTRLIAVTVEHQDPVLAQKICQTLVNEYLRSNVEQRVSMSRDANRFLYEEAERLKIKLGKSEQALQAYKEQNQAVSLEESQNIIVEKLKELNQKVTQAKAERLKLEADHAQVKKLGSEKPDELMAISSVATALGVLEQKKRLTEQEGLIANLTQRYKPLHPKFIQAQSQMRELKASLDRTILKAAEAVGTAYEAAKETEEKFDMALKEQEQKALELNKIAIPFNVLVREVESDRALYNSIITRLKETDVTKAMEQDTARVVEPAVIPEKPIKPRTTVVTAVALLGGLLSGLVFCLVLNSMDSSLKTVDRAEQYLGMAAIAAVPIGPKVSSSGTLPLLSEPHGLVAEAFRTLRTSLSLLGRRTERQTFIFTSAVPGEGKSFCSSNYAISLAQQGLRTLLIDADLRLPTVGKMFFQGQVLKGLSDCLAGQAPADQCIQEVDIEHLFVMTAGNRPPNPAELLSGNSFGELIKELSSRFDHIVIDSPPVHAVSDTLLLVKYAQSVCLVVHAGKTPAKAVLRANAKLVEAGAKPVGFILNRLPKRGGGGYYYHYSAGQYGEGVYGAAKGAGT